MSRKDGALLASRTLASLLVVWALSEASYFPERLYSFLHYIDQEHRPATEYWHHYHFIVLGFLVIRLVGFSLMAAWLYRGGPEVEDLLSATAPQERAVQD